MTNTINIDLWFWHLDASPADIGRWQSYLDRVEQARMARFMFRRDQTRFTICRSRMRRILGWYTSINPRDVRFATAGRGKPVLAAPNDRDVHFNLTHTDGLACLAVARGLAVGVDLERIRELGDDFIAYSLNPDEYARVLPLEPIARQHAFFRVWTAKEAHLKEIGTGLWQSLKTFDVDVPFASGKGEFRRGALTRADDPRHRRGRHIYTFQATDEHIGALAIAPPEDTSVAIRTRWFGPLVR